jgi:RsiW-degrading membrane proteinase PrsW (M82 family)
MMQNEMTNYIALLVSVCIPAVFLWVIYHYDLYASRTFRLTLMCFAWGALGGPALSILATSVIYELWPSLFRSDAILGVVVIAPMVEELVKLLILPYISRRPEFTYFVDGAIYGFAIGIGFAVVENFVNLSTNPAALLPIAVTRVLTVNLMHGAATGLVGAAVGRARFRSHAGRRLGILGGWAVAVILHAIYNGVTQSWMLTQGWQIGTCVVIGLTGFYLIARIIRLGLREQKQWIADTLDRRVGVTGSEVRAAQSYDKLEELLEPITMQFPQKTEQIMALVLRQAQLGIKRKVQSKLEDPQQKAQLAQEIAQMQAEMEQLRKAIGPYVMVYVRSVFPEGAFNPWARMELVAAQTGPADLQKWAKMIAASRDNDATAPPRRTIFGQLDAQPGQPTDEEPK